MVTPEVMNLGVYNVGGGGGFTGSDAHVRQILAWLGEANLSFGILPEAYNAEAKGSDTRMANVGDSVRGLGYKVAWVDYAEPDKSIAGGLLAVARPDAVVQRQARDESEQVNGDADFFGLARFAGRGAVEAVIRDSNGRQAGMTGVHLNTFAKERHDELTAYFDLHAQDIEDRNPIGLIGDLNSVSYKNYFTYLMRAAGLLAAPLPGRIDSALALSRYITFVQRAGQYAAGKESRALQGRGFINAVPERTPTASLPEVPSRLIRLLGGIPAVERWITEMLKAPHMGIDQVRLFPGDQWVITESRVYAQQGEDDHTPVAASVRLLPTGVTA
jgi:hypothetical protein